MFTIINDHYLTGGGGERSLPPRFLTFDRMSGHQHQHDKPQEASEHPRGQGQGLYPVECSKVVLRAANRSRFDIVGFAPSTAFKRRADFWRYVRVKNGVVSIIQEMRQESPHDGASDVSSYWPGHTPASAIIHHHTTGKNQIGNLAIWTM